MPRRLPRVCSNHDVSLLLRLIRAHLQDFTLPWSQVDNAYYLQVDNVVIYRMTMLIIYRLTMPTIYRLTMPTIYRLTMLLFTG